MYMQQTAGRRQVPAARAGFCMPDSRADGPQCPGAAPEMAGNTPKNHGHQEADDDMLGENSDGLPDYKSD